MLCMIDLHLKARRMRIHPGEQALSIPPPVILFTARLESTKARTSPTNA
jgi:hypothetical protein